MFCGSKGYDLVSILPRRYACDLQNFIHEIAIYESKNIYYTLVCDKKID